MTQFQLVYSIVECCLGGPPKVQERVFAFVPPDKKIPNYTGRQVTVLGTLRVELQKDKGADRQRLHDGRRRRSRANLADTTVSTHERARGDPTAG